MRLPLEKNLKCKLNKIPSFWKTVETQLLHIHSTSCLELEINLFEATLTARTERERGVFIFLANTLLRRPFCPLRKVWGYNNVVRACWKRLELIVILMVGWVWEPHPCKDHAYAFSCWQLLEASAVSSEQNNRLSCYKWILPISAISTHVLVSNSGNWRMTMIPGKTIQVWNPISIISYNSSIA